MTRLTPFGFSRFSARSGLATCAALPLLVACGGGGSSAPQTPARITPPPSAATPPSWTPGRFEAASKFKDRCEIVRTTRDIDGNPYPDQAGSTLEELFWLRSWSDETYLWYDEITDQDPANFTDRLTYFDELRTTARTASGNPRDRFHFTYPTDEWEQIRSSGSTASYGARFAFIRSAPPRDIRVAYVQAGTPAAEAGLVRGTRILTIDGVDVINGSDTRTLNDGLSPNGPGETHRFGVEFPDGRRETVTLRSQTIAQAPVQLSKTVTAGDKRVGYVHFTTFSPRTAEKALFDAFTQLQTDQIDDLVLDLRYNGGGLLDIASQLSYMIAGPTQTSGRTFETLQFNSKSGGINPVTGQRIEPTPFYSQGRGFSVDRGTPLPSVSRPRVFVLTTARSCSASEAVINGLSGIDVEVIQIGGRTCGKPYGFYGTDNCGETYFTIQFRGINSKGFGDYADGFAPNQMTGQGGPTLAGCSVADDFGRELGDPDEALFANALNYIETGECLSATAKLSQTPAQSPRSELNADPAQDLLNDPRIIALTFAEEARE